MAKDAKPAEEGAEAPQKKQKTIDHHPRRRTGCGVGRWWCGLLPAQEERSRGRRGYDRGNHKIHKKKDKKKDKEAPPVFINLEPFTVNLIPETGDQYLQVVLALELEDAHSEADLKIRMPKVRNNITLLLSGKKASELLPKEGKEKLAESLKEEINSVIEPSSKGKKGEAVHAEGPVKSVLFTSFIIQ